MKSIHSSDDEGGGLPRSRYQDGLPDEPDQIHDPDTPGLAALLACNNKKNNMAKTTLKITKTIDIPLALLVELGKRYVEALEGVKPTSSEMCEDGDTLNEDWSDSVSIKYTLPSDRKLSPAKEKEVVTRKIEVGEL